MILKSLTRKSLSFRQLVDYIDKPEQKGRAITHNLLDSKTPGEISRAFLDNAQYMNRAGNTMYHDILSLSDKDCRDLEPEKAARILEDLARQWIEVRAPEALVYGRAHFNRNAYHVHVMYSANNVRGSKRNYVSRAQFAECKKELNRYLKEKYPELKHSNREKGKAKGKTIHREQERSRRLRSEGRATAEPSRKERICAFVLESLSISLSLDQLETELQSRGLGLYKRGSQYGVIDRESGKRYRLKKLGIDTVFRETIEKLKDAPERLRQLKIAKGRRMRADLDHGRDDLGRGRGMER